MDESLEQVREIGDQKHGWKAEEQLSLRSETGKFEGAWKEVRN